MTRAQRRQAATAQRGNGAALLIDGWPLALAVELREGKIYAKTGMQVWGHGVLRCRIAAGDDVTQWVTDQW